MLDFGPYRLGTYVRATIATICSESGELVDLLFFELPIREDPLAQGTILQEFSETEYAQSGHRSARARLFHGPPLFFLGHDWAVVATLQDQNLVRGDLSAEERRRYLNQPHMILVGIDLSLAADGAIDFTQVASAMSAHCLACFGEPKLSLLGRYEWNGGEGFVLFQEQVRGDGHEVRVSIRLAEPVPEHLVHWKVKPGAN